jgi:hypothetical protein
VRCVVCLTLLVTAGCAPAGHGDNEADSAGSADAGRTEPIEDVVDARLDSDVHDAGRRGSDDAGHRGSDDAGGQPDGTEDAAAADVQWGTVVDGGCPFDGPPEGSPLTLPPPATHTGCDPIPTGIDGWQPDGDLLVELGTLTAQGSVEPFAEGAWQPMVHGIQGGFHVSVYVRVATPDGDPIGGDALVLEGYAHVGCEVADAPTVAPAVAWSADPTAPGAIVVGDTEHDGFRWILPVKSTLSWQFCGRWIRGSLRVYDKSSGRSGAAHAFLRMYDTNPSLQTP